MVRTKQQWINKFFTFTSISCKGLMESLIREGEQAYLLRDYARLKRAGERLAELSPRSEHIGRLYKVMGSRKNWQVDSTQITNELESLAKTAPIAIRAAAILSIAAKEIILGKPDKFTVNSLLEASKLARECGDIVNLIRIQSQLSLLLSLDGNHQESLEVLRKAQPLLPRLDSSYDVLKLDFYNNVAYELFQLGKREASRGFASLLLRSPHLAAYPEWGETAKEIFVNKVATNPTVAPTEPLPPKPAGKLLQFKLKTPVIRTVTKSPIFMMEGLRLVPLFQCTDDDILAISELMDLRSKQQSQQSAETI